MAPIWVFDYILVHEMVHVIERRHSKDYWRLVSRVIPDYQEHVRWLNENGVNRVQSEWADLRRLPMPPQTLRERILNAVELFPCDLLFVHRDAEREYPQNRYTEIHTALNEAIKWGF